MFRKSEEAQIEVFLKSDDQENDFSYIEMIKSLLADGRMESPEVSSDFTEYEVKSIRDMVDYINGELPDEEDEEELKLIR